MGVVKITKRQLRRIIGEALLKEEMLKIISNSYSPETELFNRIANYALANDVAGAMADREVDTDDLYWLLDEMRPWVSRVGSDDWMDDDAVVPDGWDTAAVYKFMEDLEDAWHDAQKSKRSAAISADPDKDWLNFLGSEFNADITPADLASMGWKEYKNYIRVSPPEAISHLSGELHVTDEDIIHDAPGTRAEFIDFLTSRAGRILQRRKSSPPMMPYYD